MQVLVHEYDKGGRTAEEFDNDMTQLVGKWDDSRKPGEGLESFVWVACDDTEAGVARLLEAIGWLAEEVRKRKLSAVNGAR